MILDVILSTKKVVAGLYDVTKWDKKTVQTRLVFFVDPLIQLIYARL